MSSLHYRLGVPGYKHMSDRQCLNALRDHLNWADRTLPSDFPAHALHLGFAGRDGDLCRYCGCCGNPDEVRESRAGRAWKIVDVADYIVGKLDAQREARIAEFEAQEARIGLKHML